ncbi:MAG TPA: efflux RND transporter periplasmic adaptor subunit [Candidatus Acidoferrum sp.]|nr:efflux RND transporter periplasmic adaptor subunit [Candidatus Acidoferrum sp.]
MKRGKPSCLVMGLAACAIAVGCGGKVDVGDKGAPPAAKVEKAEDVGLLSVDHPDEFPLVKATEYFAAPTLNVTGVVTPDVSKTVPVISLATGRVVEIKARLGDTVKKGQVLLRVQSPDISGAFSDYRKAVADAALAQKQFERAQLLYDKGAISLNDFQVAEDANAKAKVDVETTLEHLRVLGVDKDHPGAVVNIVAPISGVITDQQVTNASGVQGLSGANPFTISDLSDVWVVCDVYENDLANVHLGELADIRLNAYPDKLLKGRISNIGPILDPNVRTAKVRVQVDNPEGLMRIGMFVTASFEGPKKQRFAVVPAPAILHLHDRDWVYVPAGNGKFRRVEVKAGANLPNKMQAISSGIEPGQEVVGNALVMQNTTEE